MISIKFHGLTAILADDWHSGKDRMVKMEDMNKQLDRREFNRLCAALGSSLPAVSAMFTGLSGASAFAAATGVDSNVGGRIVKFHDGTVVPALGQGSWHLGQGRHPEAVEEEALRTGLSLGMTLIDTAEVYGNGRSEELIGHVIAGKRDRVFLVSKVWPSHVTGNGIARACEASLTRLGTDDLDLYLLHWPNGVTDLSTCCTGRMGSPTSPALWRRSKVCARLGRLAAKRRCQGLSRHHRSSPRPSSRSLLGTLARVKIEVTRGQRAG